MARPIFGVVIEKFNTFTFPGRPAELWFGGPSVKRPGGSATDLPTAELIDTNGTIQSTGGMYDLIRQNLRIEVYAESLAAANAIEVGLKYNDGTPQQRLGFHYASGLPFDSDAIFMAMYLTAEPDFVYQQDRSAGANRVYKLIMDFVVEFCFTG